jgi:hypothetical protein
MPNNDHPEYRVRDFKLLCVRNDDERIIAVELQTLDGEAVSAQQAIAVFNGRSFANALDRALCEARLGLEAATSTSGANASEPGTGGRTLPEAGGAA